MRIHVILRRWRCCSRIGMKIVNVCLYILECPPPPSNICLVYLFKILPSHLLTDSLRTQHNVQNMQCKMRYKNQV